MRNCNENLPEEYENDGNTYCHGVVNCKYFYDGDCDFYSMGSGNPDDMPCLVQASADVKAFREWREQQEKGGMTCNNKCIHYPVCEQKKWDFANINECEYYADKDKPKGEWIVTAEDNEGIHRIQCPFCGYEKGTDFIDYITVTFEKMPPFCENCGAELKGGAE